MAEPITLDNYADLRDTSRQFRGTLQAQLNGHLETVRHLFRPAAVFGQYLVGSHKDSPRDAATAVAQFRTFFAEAVLAKPFMLDQELGDTMELSTGTPVLNDFVYTHEIETRAGARTVSVTSPLQWVLSFPEHRYSRLLELTHTAKRDVDALHAIAAHFAALHFTVLRNPRIQELFQALRFPISSERVPQLGAFPVLMVRAPAGTVRPPDEVIGQVCRYSGVDTVEEILDYEAWTNLKDPFAEQFAGVAASMRS